MRVVLAGMALVAPLALIAAPAQAQSSDGDRVASTAIAKGDFAGAEQMLLRELRIHPDRPELLINLAAVYVKTGRQGEARVLYQRVLSQDDVLLDLTPDQALGSHALAATGLRRLEFATATARR